MWTEEQVKYLHDNHGVMSTEEISRHIGKTEGAVRMRRVRDGLEPCEQRRKHFFNEHFFSDIDSEAKAYFLGYIAADGTVRNSKSRRSIRLCCHEQDIDIIENFRECIELNTPLESFNRHCGTQYVEMPLYSKTMANELGELGVIPNKVHVIEFPDIDKQYYNHYIRGYFDGDGCICRAYIKSRGRHKFYFNITSSSKSIIKSIYDILGNITSINAKIHTDPKTGCYKIDLAKKQNLLDIYNYMYGDATVFGKRKKAKFDAFIIENEFEKNTDSLHREMYTLVGGK